MQYVEFVIGQAVLTPPIPHEGAFLAGERITLARQSFVVPQDDQPSSDRSLPGVGGNTAAKVRRVVVVEASQWRKPFIDREFTWPAAPSGLGTSPAAKKNKSKPAAEKNRGKPSKRDEPTSNR